ncbi:MAG TPA: hypothetical protein VKH81_05080 [Candidatus Angelobacter sp.]|nr:hypothetical protein [Candidatus Angelobacter sp.]
MPESHNMLEKLPLTGATLKTPLDMSRPGMPAADSIQNTMDFTPRAGGPTYQIIRTTESDAYDSAPSTKKVARLLRGEKTPSVTALAAAVKAKPTGDNYQGTDRKAAKLSKATGQLENFADLQDLIKSLTADAAMAKLKIKTIATSNRVQQEERNVHVKAFLYASSKEADNDFHMIVGRDPNSTPEMYMTMEVSGLPPKGNAAFDFTDLDAARNSFKTFFGADKLPQAHYDFYHPPIPIEVQGSLFWDATHAKGQRPGPQSLKSRMPVIWEVHPVISIKLG